MPIIVEMKEYNDCDWLGYYWVPRTVPTIFPYHIWRSFYWLYFVQLEKFSPKICFNVLIISSATIRKAIIKRNS